MSKLKTAKSKNKFFDIHAPVFWSAVMLVTLFISITLVVGTPMKDFFIEVQNQISKYFGSFIILSINFFFVFCLWMAWGRFGKIRLGGNDAKPEFSTIAWFAMLFGAGMGIGLMFWGVSEPMYNFVHPPKGDVTPKTIEAYADGVKYVFLHWGFHAWAVYALVGMALAYFTFNRKLPLAVRSVFYPLLGERIYGRIGDVIDVLAVLATLFGLASSLGIGVQQIGAGFEYLFGVENTMSLQIIVIIAVTLVATISVVTGLDKGVKILSELNLYMAGLFLLFVVVVGPTMFIFDGFVENLGNYLSSILSVGLWTEAYIPNKFETHTEWQDGWTLMYHAWWIAWSPFVGLFIARISKGRTIKEFVLGVLIAPSLVTFFWISAFGGTALFYELIGFDISTVVTTEIETSLYFLMEQLPLSELSSVLAVILVISFFITSSDSGSLVVDSITSGGKLDAPVGQRIFWAMIEGVIAIILLYGGGLNAIQAVLIATGLPFTFVLILMAFSLKKALKEDAKKNQEISDSKKTIVAMLRQNKAQEETNEEAQDSLKEKLNEKTNKNRFKIYH